MLVRIAWVTAVVATIACGDRSPASPPATGSPAPVREPRVDATALFAKFECTRCHDVPGIAAAPRDKHCFRCHQQIHDGTFTAEAAVLAKWRTRITSLRWAPSLAGADRLRRSWVRDFLLAPHDVRPGLVAQMPRLPISPADAERLAAHLVPDDTTAAIEATADDLARGEQLYRGLACARCHRFTGASVDDPARHEAGRDQVKPHGQGRGRE